MLLETEKERVCINQIVGQKKQEIEAEGDVIVNDVKPDILSIISAEGIPCVYKKEVMEGKIRLDGSVNTYIIYLADDETQNVRSLNTVLDFTKVIDIEGCMPEMISKEDITINNIDCKILNSRKINVKVSLNVNSKVYSNDNLEIISKINNLEDIQVLNSNAEVNSLIGNGSTRVYAKDTISIDAADELAEIMRANIKIVNKDLKLSYNKILAKADADVSILYLTEDGRIGNLNTQIPVMGFIDIENISDNSICDLDYQIKNLLIKPNNGDMHSIYIEAEIEIVCFAYETKSINLIDDLYSVSSELNFTQKEIVTMSGKRKLREICNITEQINIPEMEGNQIYNINTVPNILNTTLRKGKVIYEGEVNIELLYEMNNSVNSKILKMPFKFETMSDEIDENSTLDTQIEVKKDDFIVNGGNVNANIELEFNINISKSQRLNIINEISEEELKDNNIYSMVIYFVKQGDTIWKIAKKFKSTTEDIIRVNNIEDVNKINVGQQLYIPKFAKKALAV